MLRSWFRRPGRTDDSPKPASARAADLQVEGLEDRAVPATFTVTTLADAGDGSLRAAVAQANTQTGADEIRFAAGLAGIIALTSGELDVHETVAVIGNGSSVLEVSGNANSRIFDVEPRVAGGVTLAIDGLTLSGGRSDGDGGAIRAFGAGVRLSNAVLTNNTAANGGGAIAMGGTRDLAGALLLENTIVYGNTATGGSGGGILMSGAFGPNLIANSMIQGNRTPAGDASGAGLMLESGFLSIAQSSFLENRAAGEGGGLFIASAGNVAIANSTFDGNRAEGGNGGGGILNDGTLRLSNSTVSFNHDASQYAAGGIRDTSAAGVELVSTIVHGNTAKTPLAATSVDYRNQNALRGAHQNLFGDGKGIVGLTGLDLVGVDPKLGELGVFGSGTAARPLLAGSAAIAKGTNPFGATNDQRGANSPRARGDGTVDIGALQYDFNNLAPTAALALAGDVTLSNNPTSYTFVVDYADANGLQATLLDRGEVEVVGPGGFKAVARLSGLSIEGNVARVTYTIAAPGGRWTAAANGTYSINLLADKVYDRNGRPAAGATLGTFNVATQGEDIGFVEALFQRVLRRNADAPSAEAYQNRLRNGETRAAIAREVWESVEHRRLQAQDSFYTVMGRLATQAETEAYAERMRGGLTEEELIAELLTAPETIARAGEGTSADALLQSYLYGESGRTRNIDAYYEMILHRKSDVEGLSYFVKNAPDRGLAAIAIELLSSDEFWNRHGARV